VAKHKRVDVKTIRQRNGIGTAPPPAITSPAPGAQGDYVFIQRKVQKGGTISLTRLTQGSRVNVVQLDDQTFVVSARPQSDVKKLLAHIPPSTPSPYAALSQQVQGRPHQVEEIRVRHGYSGPISFPEISDEVAMALSSVERTRRVR